jgi:hypothetical protein
MTQDRKTKCNSKTLHGTQAHDLEKPDVDKTAQNTWLKNGKLFPGTSGLMTATRSNSSLLLNVRG